MHRNAVSRFGIQGLARKEKPTDDKSREGDGYGVVHASSGSFT